MSGRTRRILAVGAAGLLSTFVVAGCGKNGAGGPRAVFETARKDIGSLKAGETAQLSFPLRNEGGQTLQLLSVEGGCGCLTPEYPRTIPAGGSGEIRIVFEPQLLWSGEMEKQVKVTTNDPSQPEAQLVVAAEVIPVVAMEPRSPLVIQYKPGETYRREIRLTPRADRSMTISSPEPDSPLVKAEVVPPPAGDRARTHLLRLAIGPYAGPGDMNTTVRLATTDPKVPRVDVVVVGLAQSGVVVSPRNVLLPMLKPESAGQEIARLQVFARSGGLKLLGVETGSPSLKAEVTAKTPGQFYDVVLRYTGGAKKGSLETTIRVRTDDKRFPTVSVPFDTVVQ